MKRFGIFGHSGKMGQALISCYQNFINLEYKVLKRDFKIEETLDLDFIIDFTTPDASLNLVRTLKETKAFIVCGTTGFSKNEMQEMQEFSKKIRILYSANFSIAIFKILKILKELSVEFNNFDAEILEKHHSLKKDAPSGTALLFGKTIAESRGLNFEDVKTIERNNRRKNGEIGFASVRQGLIAGFHEVSFASNDERIWIGHEAFNKNIFANGAIQAGLIVSEKFQNRTHGFFTLEDIY
jgi:4-hydroxy-tetrahydrodipicolinate reductase